MQFDLLRDEPVVLHAPNDQRLANRVAEPVGRVGIPELINVKPGNEIGMPGEPHGEVAIRAGHSKLTLTTRRFDSHWHRRWPVSTTKTNCQQAEHHGP